MLHICMNYKHVFGLKINICQSVDTWNLQRQTIHTLSLPDIMPDRDNLQLALLLALTACNAQPPGSLTARILQKEPTHSSYQYKFVK